MEVTALHFNIFPLDCLYDSNAGVQTFMIDAIHVVIIPGLGNKIQQHTWAAERWKKFGIIPHVFNTKWTIEEKGFKKKLDDALTLIDSLLVTNKKISLIGNSAGSSFAINILGKRTEKIHRVVINCGRVRTGDWPWYTFDQATASSPSFKESVLQSEKVLLKLPQEERKKILTLRPLFDEIVPPVTVPIEGATNEITPFIEHGITIALNMTLLNRRVINFLRD